MSLKSLDVSRTLKVDDFVKDLNDCNWAVDETQLINLAWNLFVNKFTLICDKHAPIKT